MSEYIRKKDLLDRLKDKMNKYGTSEAYSYPSGKYHGLEYAIRVIESGLCDAPEPSYPTPYAYEAACKALWSHREDNERLRAELVKIAEYTNPTGEDGREMRDIALEALSTPIKEDDKE